MRSGVDCADYEAAIYQHFEYTGQIYANPVDITVGGVSSISMGYTVQVLDVRKVYCGTIRAAVGGLTSNPTGYLECEWDLLPVLTS